jgi:hypothetical protein
MDTKNHHRACLLRVARPIVVPFTSIAFFACTLFALSGCLDIPDEPNTGHELESVEIVVLQAGKEDSTFLKIRPSDSSTVRASVYPRQYNKQLSFLWSRQTKDTSYVLGEEQDYTIYANAGLHQIPNALDISDEVGNSIHKEFNIVVNMEPAMEEKTVPADNDTLFGNTHTSILFKWKSYDNDDFDEDKLEHTLIIDGTTYPVGHLTEIRQSGFEEGPHTFQVIVFDTFGDSDTLGTRTFYVVDTLGGSR